MRWRGEAVDITPMYRIWKLFESTIMPLTLKGDFSAEFQI